MQGFNMDYLREMMSSPIQNYAGLPGLKSSLIAADANGANGRVRVFEASRQPREQIVPHNHRFSFQCLVLQGTVWNVIWEEDPLGDEFAMSSLYYNDMGNYNKTFVRSGRWSAQEFTYPTGEWYAMSAHEIHSIEFSQDAVVLFMEGVSYMWTTEILEPLVDGEVVPLLKVEPWMFKKEEQSND
jgi:hypothetical protein